MVSPTPSPPAAFRPAALLGSLAGGDPVIGLMLLLSALVPLLAYTHVAADVAFSGTAILFLVQSWRTQHFAWARQPWWLAALLFCLYLALRGLAAPHAGVAIGTGLSWIRFPVALAAFAYLIATVPAFPAIMLAAYCAAATFGVIDALDQSLTGHDLFGWKPAYGGSRLTSPMGKLDIGATLRQIGMPLACLGLMLAASHSRALWQRAAGALALAALSAAILLSGERVVFTLYVGALGFALRFVARQSWARVGALVAVLVVAAGIAVFTVPALAPRVANTEANWRRGMTMPYVQTPLAGLRVFASDPLFGAGFRQYRYVCPADQPAGLPPDTCNIHPHQFYIETLAENGIIGAIPFVTFMVLLLVPILRSTRRWAAEPLLAGSALAVLAHLWPLATTGSFFVSQREVIFWPLLGLAAGLAAAPARSGGKA